MTTMAASLTIASSLRPARGSAHAAAVPAVVAIAAPGLGPFRWPRRRSSLQLKRRARATSAQLRYAPSFGSW